MGESSAPARSSSCAPAPASPTASTDSKVEPVHFLQIWIVPDQRGLRPAYAQQAFDAAAAARGFVLLASREGRDGSIGVHQDVDLWVARLAPGDRRSLELEPGRNAWIHAAGGSVSLNGQPLREGDGAGAHGEGALEFVSESASEVLAFDLG